jgi:hypothetical protein
MVLVAAMLFASLQTYRQWRIDETEHLAADLAVTAIDVDTADAMLDPAIMPARMALAIALAQTRVAARTRSLADRASRLARAQELIDRALATRPGWGEAWVVATYASLVSNGGSDSETRAAFAQSLETSPYLINAAPWRIRYGAAQWRYLDAQTQSRVLNEAQWLGDMAPTYRRLVRDALGIGPAAAAFSQHRSARIAVSPPT